MKKKILFATALMAVAMAMPAYAEDADNVATLADTTPQVTKHFVMAEGLAVPAETFSFTATAVTSDAPAATIAEVDYNTEYSLGEATEGKYTLDTYADITFGTFPHAGMYEYTVKETAGNDNAITYDTAEYKLRVYVVNEDDGSLKVQTVTAEKDNEKQSEIGFTNTYRKNASLTISKSTVGSMSDKTKDFAFTITFTKSGTEDASVTSYTGKIGTEDVVCNVGTATTFYLHDGESLVFDELPVGTRYVVTEAAAADGYKPSVSVVENGVQNATLTANDADALSSASSGLTNLVGENENSATFTNTYDDIPVTGLLLNNLPAVMLIAISAVALVLLTLCKRRRKN